MQKIYWIILTVGTLAMIFVMRESGKDLVTPYTPAGIVNLELARSKSAVKNILNIWSSMNGSTRDRIQTAKINTWLDFLFIACYVPFLMVSVKKVAGMFGKRTIWASMGLQLPYFCLLAGMLDVMENMGMLLSLHNRISSKIAFFTFSCSFLKWLLVALIIGYLLTALFIKWASPTGKKLPAAGKP